MMIGSFMVDSQLFDEGELARSVVNDLTQNDGFAIIDPTWRITHLNEQAARQWQREPEELIGKVIWDVAPDLPGTTMEGVFREMMQNRRAQRYEFQNAINNRWYQLRFYPWKDGIAIYSVDITEHELAAENIRQQNAILAGINRIFQEAITCETEEELGKVCLTVAQEVTQSKFGFIGEINPETNLLDSVAISNPGWEACQIEQQEQDGEKVALSVGTHGIYAGVLLNGKSLLSNEPENHPNWIGTPQGHPTISAFLGVPLCLNGKVAGMIGLGNRPGGYHAQQVAAAEALAPAIVQSLMSKRAEIALKATHNEVVNERNRLLAVMEALPVGLAIYDKNGGVLQSNQAFEEVWGSPRPDANSVEDYAAYQAWQVDTDQPIQPEEWASAQSLEKGQAVVGQFLRIQRFDGTQGYVMNSGAPVRDAQGQISGGVVAIMDITAQVKAENALHESEDRFRVALSSLPMTVYILDKDLRYTWIYNPRLGIDAQQILGKRDDEIMPESADEFIALKQAVLDSRQGVQQEIQVNIKGERTYFLLSLEPLLSNDGKVNGLIGASLDVTAQRRIEMEHREAVTQMEIHRRLVEQREQDRQNTARDIHDGPVQTLSSISFNLQFVKENFPNPALQAELEQIGVSLKGAIQELREVVNELRPPALIRFGLAKAIMVHKEEVRERYPQIEWDYQLEADGETLPEPACLTLFRIYQEAINNIARHSQAQKAWVRFKVEPEQVTLEIEDDGQGFPENGNLVQYIDDRKFGLAGMKERADTIGGSLTIASRPGQGTLIRVVKKMG